MAGSKTIAFIEDDPFIIDMYKTALTKAGYVVDVATDGKVGLEKVKNGQYDLVLLDIMVPEMTGIEVLEHLRGKEGKDLPNTKIVILTNLAQDDSERRALEAQADGYLIKADITPRKLVELLKPMLENTPS